MVDNLTPEERSRQMARVRSKDTVPERRVRSLLYSRGYRYRLHRKELPGKPDIVFVGRKKIVFVHGCFWHGHCCRLGDRMPKSNQDYWSNKIARNTTRDRRQIEDLKLSGWDVIVVWECETKKADLLADRLISFLGPAGRFSSTHDPVTIN